MKLTPLLIEYYNVFHCWGRMYEERTYRNLVKTDDLISFEVIVQETDLFVRAERDLSKEARESILKYRYQLETYMAIHPEFVKSLVPLGEDPYAPEIVKEMIRTSTLAHVGPMAAVAGAMAEFVSKDLFQFSEQVIIENGGDIYLATTRKRMIGVFAGKSPLSLKLGISILPEDSPVGVCTSSGTVGPSLSFGKADAVCIISRSAALADAAATAVGNLVRDKKDIELGLERGKGIEGVLGTLIIVDDRMGASGEIRLIQL